jgi:uncharacterized membrane protein YdbT with pleckstrin-like domain
MIEIRQQAITGVVSPEMGEAWIRVAWPSVAAKTGLATLGRKLTSTIILAPLAWAMMGLAFFAKLMPFTACRYLLTNRRLMIQRGWSAKVSAEVPLSQIDDVRLVRDDNTQFFRAATLEIVHDGKVVLTLPGVPDPDSFRQAVLNSRNAWVPGMAKRQGFQAASAMK